MVVVVPVAVWSIVAIYLRLAFVLQIKSTPNHVQMFVILHSSVLPVHAFTAEDSLYMQ